ncbi:hypothetical protein SAMN05444397_101569 [Flavobacterium aquidurense]|uniref:PH domain-containing protein n=1 Tax=Flavobacterium frigidimaris TaxID=262320 RepID=A0ABX4BJB9_FLAFR|nr:hypothetical protein [Flavobacterium frigidimaris]OXA75399.1 hypothetical protein B0A65_21930 [Flavobacterium frigidimaris]SDY40471.1 hypothetical protein SAMN05444397_101569 [Flavobacterium aquidurense]
MLKKILLITSILLLIICGLVAYGLYAMEIDDHYGDLQEVYFDSKSGDIIVNKQTQKFGIITKGWKRADVITKENDTLDLYELIYVNQKENKYEVFRSEKELKIKTLSFEKIMKLKKKKLIETIIKN